MPISISPQKKLALIPLAAVIFLTVSGGPYGLEPVLAYAGRNTALLLLLLTPLCWDIPIILMVLELNSLMPVTGGYYQWVKRALGLRWAFFEGWWTWLYTFTDLAIYPVLFMQYAAFLDPAIWPYRIPVSLLVIWVAAGLNIRGIVPVGKASLLLSTAVLLPFFFLIASILHRHGLGHVRLSLPVHRPSFPLLGMALFTIMWNYIGWDNVTTYAQEVKRPVRSYLLAMAMAFLAIFAIYFLAVFSAQRSGINFDELASQGFPVLGLKEGGKWLGYLLAASGMASSFGIFCTVLLSVSRIPEVMAADRLLPSRLNRLHARYQTPYLSILVCAVVVSGMILWTFGDLIIIDVSLYSMGLLLEFLSLIVLRRKYPSAARPFRIPLKGPGLWLLLLLPMTVFALALTGSLMAASKTLPPLLFTLAALLSAELVWALLQIRNSARSSAGGGT